MKMIKQYYEDMQELRNAFNAADGNGNEEALAEIRGDIDYMERRIARKGLAFGYVLRMYEVMRQRGNEMIDLDDILWDHDIEELLDEFHHNGITRFTFSSTWSGAIETAWKIREAGWNLTGMIQINGRRHGSGNEYEKVPAYVFEYR